MSTLGLTQTLKHHNDLFQPIDHMKQTHAL